jgi:hypothetical protein
MQFQKGHSGNAAGRPRGSRTMSTSSFAGRGDCDVPRRFPVPALFPASVPPLLFRQVFQVLLRFLQISCIPRPIYRDLQGHPDFARAQSGLRARRGRPRACASDPML